MTVAHASVRANGLSAPSYATGLLARELPPTGMPPWWRIPLILLIASLITLAGFGGYYFRKSNR